MKDYLFEVNEIVSNIELSLLHRAIQLIDECAKRSGTLFIIGNGGSASISSHFSTDLVKAGYFRKKPIRAFSLVDNSSLLTATANDFSYADSFSWQINEFAQTGDLLFAISSSGNSANIQSAISRAKSLEIKTISLSGFDGGLISKNSDISLVTKSQLGSYGPVEDAHSIICHYIASEIKKL